MRARARAHTHTHARTHAHTHTRTERYLRVVHGQLQKASIKETNAFLFHIASNFPQCPSWFNEGLASLYEQCGERNGKIQGLTNWRLAGLQRAIQRKGVPSFQELCETTTREFYHDQYGTNYGQARYLCYYLQQQGLLRKFYHQFAKNAEQDPTGLQTLASVLRQDDMDAFKKHWETYVADLKYR